MPCAMLISIFVLAEVLVKSPRKLVIFIMSTFTSVSKYPRQGSFDCENKSNDGDSCIGADIHCSLEGTHSGQAQLC